MEFHRRDLVAEELQPDDDIRIALFIERAKAIARGSERVLTRVAVALGILLALVMVARCTPGVIRHFTASPAPRSLAPSAIANPQPRAFEADARPTYQVR